MGIVTKKGDSGKTSLLFGGIVDKDSPRIEFLGYLDELSSFIGLSKCLIKNRTVKGLFEAVQKDIICICKEAATPVRFLSKIGRRLDKKDLFRLEGAIRELELKLKSKKFSFCLPGVNRLSSILHVTRTIARRTERLAVKLSKEGVLKNKYILMYLNRLSDLLYMFARRCEEK